MQADLIAHVANFLRQRGFAQTPGVIALSGGPDSVALAWMATTLLRSGHVGGLCLAHVNHLLRGNDSDADEAFVAQLGRDWGVDCRTTRIDVRAEAAGENIEAAARRLRYAWLAQIARETGAAWVGTGHTADDQAETVLFRLVRGSGLQGLRGIPRMRRLDGDGSITLLRPLLDVSRRDILAFLETHSLSFRVDLSNEDRTLARNRLRHEVLPILKEQNSAIVEVLGRLAEQAAQVQDEILLHAKSLLHKLESPRAGDMLVLSLAGMSELTPFWRREVFRLIWQREGWPMAGMNYADWQRLAELVEGGSPAIDFPGSIHARRCERVLQLSRGK